MAVRTAGIWIFGLSLAFAAIPAAIMGLAKGAAGLQQIGPSMVILLLAAVVAAVGIIPTFAPTLWNGRQANGMEDGPGRLEIRITSAATVVFAGIVMLAGAVTMILMFPSAMSQV
jgi:hypothetical protein